jgi:DNA-directed RNA polymerase subunit H (RpoH/RPB5)
MILLEKDAKMNNNVLWLNKLVPKHVLLDDENVESKLKPLNVTREQLPKILLKDPALKALDEEAKPGDVVEIHRFSENAGSNLAYRLVVEE